MVTITPPPPPRAPIVRLLWDDCPGSISRNRCIDRKADGATYVKVADTLSSMRKRKEDDRAVKLARARDRIEAENKARVEKVKNPEHGDLIIVSARSRGSTTRRVWCLSRKSQCRRDMYK